MNVIPKTAADPAIGRCAVCGRDRVLRPSDGIYDMARWRGEIMRTTPQEVWASYLADGYSMREAVESELSYVG